MVKPRMLTAVAVALITVLTLVPDLRAEEYKVLVVMSYEDDYPWDVEVKEGIDTVLSDKAELRYFYMNTKTNLAGSAEKGKEAYQLFKDFQPDGVIAMDDNAQKDFVLPYIKGKADAPVIFGGVNAEPDAYGYPTDQISGILDRFHISESIAFAQQLVPTIKTVGFILKESPTARLIHNQVENERENYSAEITGFHMVKTLAEALSTAAEKKKNTDLLYVAVLSGVTDSDGEPLNEKQAVRTVADAFGGPTTTNLKGNVKNGTLCAVVKTGQEQGAVAAEMLLKALEGAPVGEMEITRNRHGKRVINAAVLKELGIKPNAAALRGAEIVTTEP